MLRHDFAAIFIYDVPADIPHALRSVIMQRFPPQEALPETGFLSGHPMPRTGAFDAPVPGIEGLHHGHCSKDGNGLHG